jgi:5-methylthioadenosine/S-adenosylhomocysteine deaminase
VSSQEILLPQYIVPVRPREEVLVNHAVVVSDGRIVAIKPREEAAAQYPGATRVELPSHVLLPGLINMHTHSAMTLLRGYADDLELNAWLQEHIWPAERRWLSREFVRDGTELAIAEMLRCGTTCFNEMYFYTDVIAEVVDQAGLRACIGSPVIEFETAWASGFDDYFGKALELQDSLNEHDRISMALAPHAAYTVTDRMLERIADHSAQHDLKVHMHLLEIAWEIQHSLQEYGVRPLQRLEQLGLLNPRLIAIHMAHLGEEDVGLLAQTGVNVVHCPESNLKLASGFCPVSGLLQAGVNVSVGTDGAASNNNLDLLGELRVAALLAKGLAGDPCAVDAAAALELITINAAEALGLSEDIGSIEVGKAADFCALDLDCPETQPVHQVVSQVVYAAASRQVSDVWVGGRRLLDNGALTTLDLDAILAKAKAWNQRMEPHCNDTGK